jgi:hypothetical protein
MKRQHRHTSVPRHRSLRYKTLFLSAAEVVRWDAGINALYAARTHAAIRRLAAVQRVQVQHAHG